MPSRQGNYDRKLCNFIPWLVREITVDDGMETSTRIVLAGIHSNGTELPEVEIRADEFSAFSWLPDRWGMNCILETGIGVKDSLRYAIQSTADQAERQTIYTVTGWRKLDGQWQFLMPGDDSISVSLEGKLRGYNMEHRCEDVDICTAYALLHSTVAPPEILMPLMAYTFLSPLNHFLKLAGHEPKFVLFLVGKTGSRKSTLAALFLSFFGWFTGSDLPLSFRDTANSILHHTYELKDVLTCIDDFHPAGRMEEGKLTASAQTIMRAYGDRTGKGRLKADSSPMAARPPQGNAIITGEFPPNIGESGTARYFSLELGSDTVDLEQLTIFQKLAAEGHLPRCMFGYVEWLKAKCLCDEEQTGKFIAALADSFGKKQKAFLHSGIRCHGRVAEAVAWLELSMEVFLHFLMDKLSLGREEVNGMTEQFRATLYRLAVRQADSIEQDKPTHIFVRKLYALLESGQAQVMRKDLPDPYAPPSCIGYEDDEFYYLYGDIAFQAVRRLCNEQGEVFAITLKGLLKQLAEEGLIEGTAKQNTKSVRFDGKSKRVVCLRKDKARQLMDVSM